MTKEEMEKDESNEKPKTIGDLRPEAAESPCSEEEAKAALKALLYLTDRIEEWRQSASDDQRKRFDEFAKEIESPLFGLDLAQVDKAREIIDAERARDRSDTLLSQQTPSPEAMQLKELRELRKNLERAHNETRCWQIASIVLPIISSLLTVLIRG